MQMKVNSIYTGNSIDVLRELPSDSIDCCITSPPYWRLRDYGHEKQLGQEPHYDIFIRNLADIFDEVRRVLKETGTCFVNLGDTYGTKSGNMHEKSIAPIINKRIHKSISFEQTDLGKHKCLLMIPERFAIEMISRGWTLRNQIIWHKPNQMPSSAKDRFTVDFEKIFFFTKNPINYYFEQQMERSKWFDIDSRSKVQGGVKSKGKSSSNQYAVNKVAYRSDGNRNVRTVWSVNTKGITENHFATFPQTLVERMVSSGCPIDGIVIDPFFGSGTTGICARKLNRKFVGIELNPDNVKIAEGRLRKELGLFQ